MVCPPVGLVLDDATFEGASLLHEHKRRAARSKREGLALVFEINSTHL
jgi:hypothetical protein